jgi:RHS repeat-associated protein
LYNLLNLPASVTHDTMGSMTFEYTFGGEKIKKTSPDGERQYVGGMEYKDGGLQLIHIPNGRITEKEGVKKYQYHLADHLGNIVVLFEDVNEDGTISIEEDSTSNDNEIIQRNHYYSFGMRVDAPHFALSADPRGDYLYNGKELQEELDLNWLAYGFRMYDPAIGRFPSVDPIADEFAHVSGFNYAENSPIANIDLWGLQAMAANASRRNRSSNFQQENPKTALFALSVPIGIVTGGQSLKAQAQAIGISFLFESAASLFTNGDLSQVDYADISISGMTGSFWGGVFAGSMIDVKGNGTVETIGGIFGNKKSNFSIGLDIAVGGFGKSLEVGFGALSKKLDSVGEDLMLGATDLLEKDATNVVTNTYIKNIDLSTGTNKVSDRLWRKGEKLKDAGEIIGKATSKSSDATVPYLQKRWSTKEDDPNN